MIQFILMDIEGTTTSISFVHEVLFPYASANLEGFVRKEMKSLRVREALDAVKTTVLAESNEAIDDDQAIQQLLDWIKSDRKHTALKSLQGYLWKDGYLNGEYQGHIYPDVPPVLEQWKVAGIGMGIYSSGSVPAQKLLFGYSMAGDLNPFFSAYFDTRIGHKKEVESYQNIAEKLTIAPELILFLSDVEAELDAAEKAGFKTTQLVRPGTTPSDRHRVVNSFNGVLIEV